MTSTSHHEFRVGLFAAIAGTLVGVVIAVWGGLHLFHHRDRYVIDIDGTVYGLVRGADVYYNGIPVGSVRSIDVAPGDIRHVRVEIAVDGGTPVRTDTTAMLSLAGITGSKVIDLHAGAADAPPLPPGGAIAVAPSTFDRLERQLDQMAAESAKLVERADRVAAGAQTAVDNLAKLTDPARYGELIASSRAAVGELSRAAAAIRGAVDEDRTPLRASIADLRQASRSFKELAREVREQPSRLLISSPKSDRRLP